MKKLFIFFSLLAASAFNCQQEGEKQPAQSQADKIAAMQLKSMRRTACLVLQRYHSYEYKEQIGQAIQQLEQQAKKSYLNKIFASAIEKCEQKITEQEIKQVYDQDKQFKPSQLFHTLQGANYLEVNDYNLTPNQEQISNFMNQFDRNMKYISAQNQYTNSKQKQQKEKVIPPQEQLLESKVIQQGEL